jgi:hypothetical protein
MPKGIDPKAYAARVTKAKKTVAAMDPAMKKKLEQYYPKISKADLAKQMLSPKTTLSDMEKRIKARPTATPKTTAGSSARRTTSQVVADRKKRMTSEVNAFGKTSASSKATKTSMPKTATKAPAKPTVKAPVKKKVTVMPDKISPSKMTPAQKARYLKNPERYDG